MTAISCSAWDKYGQAALWLALFTIVYNIAEGLVSLGFGIQDETLALSGFGIDSFIEVLSGAGILAMVLRIRRSTRAPRPPFEQSALRITGVSFYLLALGLGATAAVHLFTAHKPVTTLPGLVISLISIVVMSFLVAGKRRVGHALDSEPILADASCTIVCIYMSVVLLVSSLVYQLTGFGFVDSLGAAGLIYFSIHEGKEAFEKAAALPGEEGLRPAD